MIDYNPSVLRFTCPSANNLIFAALFFHRSRDDNARLIMRNNSLPSCTHERGFNSQEKAYVPLD